MTKDTQISIRLSTELLARIDAAAKALSDQVGVPVSRNAWIESTLGFRCTAIENGASPNLARGIFGPEGQQ